MRSARLWQTLKPSLLLQRASPKRTIPVSFLLTRRGHHNMTPLESTNNVELLSFFTSKRSTTGNHDDDFIRKEQQRSANLGSMIEYLKEIIPESLSTVPNTSKLDENIQLRVSPTITNVPIIKGQLSYLTSLKATQIIFKNFILSSDTKFHVIGTKVNYTSNYGILGSGVTKIVIRWRTCEESCHHLADSSKVDSDVDKHRVLFGIYVFELNDMNNKILVHNVENVEICNDHEKKFNDLVGIL